ncbi:hypothetical protein [Ketogulonicigenium vulgare]|uniref:hypothetical protein n=1 Tax=Ketogulonicigenium vulgare TaxID=92945 RepID=UPI002359C41A|nr:hypothetical protein [Ketogulonicigenium vulgare]
MQLDFAFVGAALLLGFAVLSLLSGLADGRLSRFGLLLLAAGFAIGGWVVINYPADYGLAQIPVVFIRVLAALTRIS